MFYQLECLALAKQAELVRPAPALKDRRAQWIKSISDGNISAVVKRPACVLTIFALAPLQCLYNAGLVISLFLKRENSSTATEN